MWLQALNTGTGKCPAWRDKKRLLSQWRTSHEGLVLQMLQGEPLFGHSWFSGLLPGYWQANTKWSAGSGGSLIIMVLLLPFLGASPAKASLTSLQIQCPCVLWGRWAHSSPSPPLIKFAALHVFLILPNANRVAITSDNVHIHSTWPEISSNSLVFSELQ